MGFVLCCLHDPAIQATHDRRRVPGLGDRQPRGRYELVRGRVVAMAPERARHDLVKAAVFRALDDAVKRAGLPCTVFTDGMSAGAGGSGGEPP